MLIATFRTKYPEYATAQPDAFVQQFLDEASRSIDAEVASDRYDDMHGLLTAHLLALSPHGKNARMVTPATGNTPYKTRYDAMVIECTAGLGRVI